MPVYEVEAGGTTFEVEAPDSKHAQSAARLMIVRQRMTQQATVGAERRSAPARANERYLKSARSSLAAGGGGGTTIARPEDMPEGAGSKLTLAGTIASLPFVAPTVASLVTVPAATGKMLLGGLAGSAVGKEAGEWIGHRVPIIGGETAGKVLGAVGSLAGGGVGAAVAPKIAGRQLANVVTGGRFGSLLGAAETKPTAAVTEAAKQRLANEAERLALKRKAVEIAERRLAIAENKAAATAQKVATETGRPVKVPTGSSGAPVVVPATTGIPVAAAPDETIILKLQQEMQTSAGRKAVREYLNTLPKETASQIRLLLARGQAHPGTAAAGGMRSAGSVPTARERGLGEELARMLGQ